jgi:SAM-dependent methyltransferase/TusA-related sulfurtransferase
MRLKGVMVYITSANKDAIFDAVRAMYTDVARYPHRGYHFPTGHAACTFVGYPSEQLARVPAFVLESFAGVGYPFAANVIRAGDTVLDIGSGSGTDVLLAAQAVGPTGQVIGLDMTTAMLAKLDTSVDAAGASNVRLLEGNAEKIPLPDGSVDVVTSNGVLNLVPDKRAAFAEIHRVLRPGGRVQVADIALGRPLTGDCLSNPKLWAECVVGATLEDEYLALLETAGFDAVETVGRLDYFSASTSAETRSIARSFNANSIVLRAVKPPASSLPPPSPWPPAAAAMTPAGESHVAATNAPTSDAVLNGYGQLCGTLEPAMRAEMRALESGMVLEVRVDDPAARLGVPAWTRLAGHALLTTVEEDDRRTRFFLRKR